MADDPDLAAIYGKMVRNEILDDSDTEVLRMCSMTCGRRIPPSSPRSNRSSWSLLHGSESPGLPKRRRPRPPRPRRPNWRPSSTPSAKNWPRSPRSGYREVYTVTNPLGKVVIRYERQATGPALAAGEGEVVEHVDVGPQGESASSICRRGVALAHHSPRRRIGTRFSWPAASAADQLSEVERQAMIDTLRSAVGLARQLRVLERLRFPVDEMLRAPAFARSARRRSTCPPWRSSARTRRSGCCPRPCARRPSRRWKRPNSGGQGDRPSEVDEVLRQLDRGDARDLRSGGRSGFFRRDLPDSRGARAGIAIV
jgi:hypothetical protein